MYIAVVIALLFYIISSVMDYVISYVGTQRGVADEGTGLLLGYSARSLPLVSTCFTLWERLW